MCGSGQRYSETATEPSARLEMVWTPGVLGLRLAARAFQILIDAGTEDAKDDLPSPKVSVSAVAGAGDRLCQQSPFQTRACHSGTVRHCARTASSLNRQSLLADGLLVPSARTIDKTRSPSLAARFQSVVTPSFFMRIWPTSIARQ